MSPVKAWRTIAVVTGETTKKVGGVDAQKIVQYKTYFTLQVTKYDFWRIGNHHGNR